MKPVYLIMVPLEDGATWFRLCECHTPEAAGAVVTALMAAGLRKPMTVKVEMVLVPEG